VLLLGVEKDEVAHALLLAAKIGAASYTTAGVEAMLPLCPVLLLIGCTFVFAGLVWSRFCSLVHTPYTC
jgi:hypothetical protein